MKEKDLDLESEEIVTTTRGAINRMKQAQYNKGHDDGRRSVILEQRRACSMDRTGTYRLANAGQDYDGLSAAQMADILGMRCDARTVRALGKVLRRMGWVKKQRRIGGKVVWCWFNKEE
jgi:hypothetical protein